MRTLKLHKRLIFFLAAVLLHRCSSTKFITPAPLTVPFSTTETSPIVLSDTTESVDSTAQIDFGIIFSDSIDRGISLTDSSFYILPQTDTVQPESSHVSAEEIISYRYPPYLLTSNMVRVAIQKKASMIALYSVGLLMIHSSSIAGYPLQGRMTLQKEKGARVKIEASGKSQEVTLPCTLLSPNSYNFIEFDGKSYRGAMIVAQDVNGGVILINYLDVEEYLRGVIPLEIGRCTEREIEALKAQAVAARTYTYRRIKERVSFPFDMTNSVADQVYGGADAEHRESDMAVSLTSDLVLTYNGSLVYAYYHSTCGGKTASVDKVWNKTAVPYLVSINDTDSNGRAYCSISPVFTWQERWTRNQFESIVRRNLQGNSIRDWGIVKGDQMSISIRGFNSCGRVNTLSIKGDSWQRDISGDRTRYVLRRNQTAQPILRSAKFTISTYNNKDVIISGRGFGHGVGMCQMGAIGRSRQGQQFETILKSYYTGAVVSQGIFLKGIIK